MAGARPRAEQREPGTLILRVEGPAAIEIQHSTQVIRERGNQFLGWHVVAPRRAAPGAAAPWQSKVAIPSNDPAAVAVCGELRRKSPTRIKQALARLGTAVNAADARGCIARPESVPLADSVLSHPPDDRIGADQVASVWRKPRTHSAVWLDWRDLRNYRPPAAVPRSWRGGCLRLAALQSQRTGGRRACWSTNRQARTLRPRRSRRRLGRPDPTRPRPGTGHRRRPRRPATPCAFRVDHPPDPEEARTSNSGRCAT